MMASIPVIHLPDDDMPSPAVGPPIIPSFTIDAEGDETPNVREHKETSLTTVKITSDNISLGLDGGQPRRRSVVEIETTTVTESFALVPEPLSPEGGLFAPPVSNRRRISVAQWRDIKASLFDKSIEFDDTSTDDQEGACVRDSSRELQHIEDTFWAGKRSLIPNYDAMEKIDRLAINGPSVPQKDIGSLVNELTMKIDGELEKFRVIFRWISHNISYDSVFLNTGTRADQSPSTVLETGVAICEGFSQLLSEMCRLTGIQCESIVGSSKAIDFHPGEMEYLQEQGKHAWNRVHLGNKWYLCDSAWAAGISNRGPDGKYTFERRYGECYFLANPDQFAETHLTQEIEKDPCLALWANSIQVAPAAVLYKLKCSSHNTGVIQTKDTKVLITIDSAYPLDSYCRLIEDHSGQEIPHSVVHWWDNGILTCHIELPKAGKYIFTAYGTLPYDDLSMRESLLSRQVSEFYGTRLMTFTIIAEGDEVGISLPVGNHEAWSVGTRCIRKGFSAISHVAPFVDAVDGRATLSFQQIGDLVPVIAQFSHADDPEVRLEEYVYIETVAQRLVCHVSCPKQGKYVFILKMKYSDDKYYRAAAYIITSSREFEGGDDTPITFPKGHSGTWGPNDTFFEMGLTVRGPDSSTILAKDGEYYFVIRCDKSRDLEMNMTLKSAGTGEELRNGHAFIQSAKGKTTTTASISLRLSEEGMYELKVFARIEPGADRSYVGSWLVVCERHSLKSLFPKGAVNCGPTDEFYEHGLETDEEALVEVLGGECELEMTLNQVVFLTFSLKIGDAEKDVHQGKLFAEVVKRDDKTVAVFKFRFHETGLFAFRLFVKKTPKQDKATFVGMWLIDCQEASHEEPYAPRSGLWGPNAVFHSAGMSLKDLKTSHIQLRNGEGKLCITHRAQRSAKKMSFRLDKNGVKYDASRLINAETIWSKSGSEIITTLHFRVDQPGMYALLIFDGSKQSSAFAGHWLIECQQATTLPIFPEHSGMWGPSEHFFKMEMNTENLESSTIQTDSGQCQLDISSASIPFHANFHLYEEKKSNRLPKDYVSLNYTSNSAHMVHCCVKLPHPGTFGLQFYAAKKGTKTLNNCGIWLLIWR